MPIARSSASRGRSPRPGRRRPVPAAARRCRSRRGPRPGRPGQSWSGSSLGPISRSRLEPPGAGRLPGEVDETRPAGPHACPGWCRGSTAVTSTPAAASTSTAIRAQDLVDVALLATHRHRHADEVRIGVLVPAERGRVAGPRGVSSSSRSIVGTAATSCATATATTARRRAFMRPAPGRPARRGRRRRGRARGRRAGRWSPRTARGRTGSRGRPAKRPSVSGRSPTIIPSSPTRRAQQVGHGAGGACPPPRARRRWRCCTLARMAPPPGISPSGVG